jgi:type IV secretion system protein TrbG
VRAGALLPIGYQYPAASLKKDCRKTFRSLAVSRSLAGVESDRAAIPANDQPIAVVFDLMNPISAGRWAGFVIPAQPVVASKERRFILVKPTLPDVVTSLVINTDRRTYHMELRSTEKTYMASVSWAHPEDQIIALRRQNAAAEAASPVERFRYTIEGDNPPWRPLHAFDDGRKVYIEFPRGLAQGEMPPLFIIGPDGETSELVNYRVRGSDMIVDRLFAAAELRLGDKGTERRVRIVRNDGGLTW